MYEKYNFILIVLLIGVYKTICPAILGLLDLGNSWKTQVIKHDIVRKCRRKRVGIDNTLFFLFFFLITIIRLQFEWSSLTQTRN
jgi:hypothetical protein